MMPDPVEQLPMPVYPFQKQDTSGGSGLQPALRDAFDRWVALHGEPVPLLLHHLTGPYGRADL
jgi:hypothetical protein